VKNEESKYIKRRLNVMLAFLITAYLPFLLVITLRFDIINDSLSRIGWQLGGLGYLFVYVLYTVPFMVYQIYTFLTISAENNRLLKLLIVIGGMLIAMGAVFPVKETSPHFSHMLHSYLCQIGAVLTIITATYMVALYCKKNTSRIRVTAIAYAILLAITAVAFVYLYTAALFEAGASLLFLIAMYLLNSKSHKNQEKDSHFNISQTLFKHFSNNPPVESKHLMDAGPSEIKGGTQVCMR